MRHIGFGCGATEILCMPANPIIRRRLIEKKQFIQLNEDKSPAQDTLIRAEMRSPAAHSAVGQFVQSSPVCASALAFVVLLARAHTNTSLSL